MSHDNRVIDNISNVAELAAFLHGFALTAERCQTRHSERDIMSCEESSTQFRIKN
ncbi:MAG: hypothetical protein IJW31_01515 [Lentisphaeria bacterium]|nr:hypothetical protein [Lentisphaeria bacterium]